MFGEVFPTGGSVGRGELEKEGHTVRSWKRRLFELRGDVRPPRSATAVVSRERRWEDDEEMVLWSMVYFRTYQESTVASVREEREARGALVVGGVEHETAKRELRVADATSKTWYKLRADTVFEAARWAAVLRLAASGASVSAVSSAWEDASTIQVEEAKRKSGAKQNRSGLLAAARSARTRNKYVSRRQEAAELGADGSG